MIETNGFQMIEGTKQLRKDSSCTNKIHGQRDAQRNCFIYPRPTLRIYVDLVVIMVL